MTCAVIWIASKFEDVDAMSSGYLVHLTDNAYTVPELVAMEIRVLSVLDYNLRIACSIDFADQFLQVYSHTNKNKKSSIYFCFCYLCLGNSARFE